MKSIYTDLNNHWTFRKIDIERFIIRILIIGGVIASSVTTLIQFITFQSFEPSVIVGLVATGFMSIFLVLTKFNKVILAGILTTSLLLILMSAEVVFAQFLKQSSVATLIVLGFSNSVAYKGKTRFILHSVTFIALTLWLVFLENKVPILPDNSSYLSVGINLLGTYVLLALITYFLKKRYDKTIVELNNTLSKLKDTQSHLIQSEKMAALGTLSAGVAHELNNPLNFVHNGLQLLKENLDEDTEAKQKIASLLNAIEEGEKRATTIVNSLLEFSHTSNEIHSDVSIKNTVVNCLALVSHLSHNRIEIETIYENEQETILGNQGGLHQVFMNVITNAIQSIYSNGTIRIVQSSHANMTEISISDTGVGIPTNDLEKILDPFFTTKNPGEGTGLGLSVSYTIMKEHHGSIAFKSELGIGTTVTLTFPKKSA